MDDFRARRASGSSALAGETRKEIENDKSSSNVVDLAGKNDSSM